MMQFFQAFPMPLDGWSNLGNRSTAWITSDCATEYSADHALDADSVICGRAGASFLVAKLTLFQIERAAGVEKAGWRTPY